MVFSTGEILVDMIASKNGETTAYARYAGGAPFNVACAVKKCGGDSGFYGRVGMDTMAFFYGDLPRVNVWKQRLLNWI